MATADDMQNEIILELGGALLGGPDPDDLTKQMMISLNEQMPTIWDIAALWAGGVPPAYRLQVQFLAAKKRATLVVMGQLRSLTDQVLGRLRVSRSQAFKNLEAILKEAADALSEILKIAVATGAAPAVGPITGPVTTTTDGVPFQNVTNTTNGFDWRWLVPGQFTPDPTLYPWLYI